MKYSHSYALIFTLAAAGAISSLAPAAAHSHKHHPADQQSQSVSRRHEQSADRPKRHHHEDASSDTGSESAHRKRRHEAGEQASNRPERKRHHADQADNSDSTSGRHHDRSRKHDREAAQTSDSRHMTRHERRLEELHEEHLAQVAAKKEREKHLTKHERRLAAEHEAHLAHQEALAQKEAHKEHLAHLARLKDKERAAQLAERHHGKHLSAAQRTHLAHLAQQQAVHEAHLAKIQAMHLAHLAKILARQQAHLKRLAEQAERHKERLEALAERREAQAAVSPSSSIHEWNDYAVGVPVKIIMVDLNDPRVKVSALLSSNGIGSSEPFSHMIARSHPDVAVTGTFFSLDNLHPVGDIVINGNLAYFGGMGTALCITPNNHADMVTVPWGRHHDWSGYDCVVACGPRLLGNGQIVLDPGAERFKDRHMLAPNSRIGVGITRDNKLVFVMTHSAIYLGRLAKVMKALGCVQAMNLDAGTSTGFYCGGHLLACPGRRLTNAIVIYANGRPVERTAGSAAHEESDNSKPPA